MARYDTFHEEYKRKWQRKTKSQNLGPAAETPK